MQQVQDTHMMAQQPKVVTITKLLGTSLTLGDGTAGTDITVTFDGETSDGVLKWMEDEDYFEFSMIYL